MSEHTPGPWEWSQPDATKSLYAVFGRCKHGKKEKFAPLCTVYSLANVPLLIAAPDLLEALRKIANEVDSLEFAEAGIREVIGNTNWAVLRDRVGIARAAIAKAERETE